MASSPNASPKLWFIYTMGRLHNLSRQLSTALLLSNFQNYIASVLCVSVLTFGLSALVLHHGGRSLRISPGAEPARYSRTRRRGGAVTKGIAAREVTAGDVRIGREAKQCATSLCIDSGALLAPCCLARSRSLFPGNDNSRASGWVLDAAVLPRQGIAVPALFRGR